MTNKNYARFKVGDLVKYGGFISIITSIYYTSINATNISKKIDYTTYKAIILKDPSNRKSFLKDTWTERKEIEIRNIKKME